MLWRGLQSVLRKISTTVRASGNAQKNHVFRETMWNFLIGLLVCEIAAEVMLVEYNRRGDKLCFFVGAILAYITMAYVFVLSMKRVQNIAILNSVWQASNILIMVLVSIFLYKQTLTRPQQLGILLEIAGVLLLVGL